MSRELEQALSLLVEKSIYGNKENNRGSIFNAETIIKQALEDKDKRIKELEKEVEYYKKGQAYEAKIGDDAYEKLNKIREILNED